VRRPPDWLIYVSGVAILALLALAKHERADAPAAPPPMPETVAAMTAASSVKPSTVHPVRPDGPQSKVGTAFSVSDAGVWLTARHVVQDCRKTAVMVGPGRGVSAEVFSDPANDVAVLTTQGGAQPLPLAVDYDPPRGRRAYHPGFPQGGPGEATSRLLGPTVLRSGRRGTPAQTVHAWAEVGRTDGLKGSLEGLSGAPVLDRSGRVVGMTLSESPRRGRLYSAPVSALRAALAAAGRAPSGFARGQSINLENYGRAADDLRRDLRVAEVVCLS
jgi:S1-C subfamily serine protease